MVVQWVEVDELPMLGLEGQPGVTQWQRTQKLTGHMQLEDVAAQVVQRQCAEGKGHQCLHVEPELAQVQLTHRPGAHFVESQIGKGEVAGKGARAGWRSLATASRRAFSLLGSILNFIFPKLNFYCESTNLFSIYMQIIYI